MKNRAIILLMAAGLIFSYMPGHAERKDIKPSELPADVLDVLKQYCTILSTSPDLETCAKKLAPIAGGHLLDSQEKISRDVLEFSLKKDFQNIKFYQLPPVITRIQRITDDYDGYESTLIQGTRYKIWIAKKEGVAGMPAPIPIIKPEKGSPKVVSNIGSL